MSDQTPRVFCTLCHRLPVQDKRYGYYKWRQASYSARTHILPDSQSHLDYTLTMTAHGAKTYPPSVGGYVIMLCNGAIAWGARKLRIVPDSTAEAETAVASPSAKETVAVRMIVNDIRAGVHGPTPLFGDCQAARDIITKPGSTQRTRYVECSTMLVKRMYMCWLGDPCLVCMISHASHMY